MGLAVSATSSLRFCTGVANPITRHPASMAACIGTIQVASGGRAELGIARGDSALAYIGLAPSPIETFSHYVQAVQKYLSGEDVSFELVHAATGGPRRDVRSSQSLAVQKLPMASRMQWLPGEQPKVPLNVFATGPKVIEVGALAADRLTFAVGADPVRIRWAIGVAREARQAAGLDPEGISFAAMLGLGLDIDGDPARARARIASSLATTIRFSHMHKTLVGPAEEADAAVFRHVRDAYDMTRHGVHNNSQGSVLLSWFMDKHAIIGKPSTCVARLLELYELGLDRIVLQFHSTNHGIQEEIDAVFAAFGAEVIPEVRRG